MVGTLEKVLGRPILATQAGAYMRPHWYAVNLDGGDVTQALLDTKTRAVYEDALKVVFHEQELAGLDLFTDGCLRYNDWWGGFGWASHATSRLSGVRWRNDFGAGPLAEEFFNLPTQPRFLKDTMWAYAKSADIIERIQEGNLQFAQFFRVARRLTERPLRYTTPEASITSFFLTDPSGVYKDYADLLFDLCKVFNRELKKLVEAGADIIQLDYPFLPAFYMGTYAKPEQWQMGIEAFNEEVRGIDAQIWIHLDWGRPMNQLAAGMVFSLEEFFRRTADAKYDVVGMEAASTGGEMLAKELPAWKEHCPDKDVCIGGVNHRTTIVEPAEIVARTIRRALEYVPAEQLAVYNDCGLSALPRPIAFGKLEAIVEGCRLVRKELGLET